MMLRSIYAALVIACLSLVGCASHLTNQEIDTFGTKKYDAPKDKLTEDIAVVLKGMGYEVIVADGDKGIVKTSRKEIGSSTQTTGRVSSRNRISATSVSTSYYRQYLVKVSETSGGKMKVRVTPKVFIGERDVSNDSVWNIEGRGGERELWGNFFSELESVLDDAPARKTAAADAGDPM